MCSCCEGQNWSFGYWKQVFKCFCPNSVFEYYHEVAAEIVPGHGIASGKKKDDRFPNGTISMQIPIFKSLGLNLNHFHQGTLNLKISPFGHELGKPSHFFFPK